MVDETDITEESQWFNEERARTVIKNLQRRNMNGQYVPNRQEALAAVMAMIPPGAVVARGDSISFEQVGLSPNCRSAPRTNSSTPLPPTRTVLPS